MINNSPRNRGIPNTNQKQTTMTFYMTRAVTTRTTQTDDATIKLWKHIADKSNWRITQLPNGYYQTE